MEACPRCWWGFPEHLLGTRAGGSGVRTVQGGQALRRFFLQRKAVFVYEAAH